MTFTYLNHYTFHFKVHIISTYPEIWEINILQYKSKVFFLPRWAYVLNQNCFLLFLPLFTLRLWKKNPSPHNTKDVYLYTLTICSTQLYRKADLFISTTGLTTQVVRCSLEVAKLLKGKGKRTVDCYYCSKPAWIPSQPCANVTSQGKPPAISWPSTMCNPPLKSKGSAEVRKPHSTHPEGTRGLLQGWQGVSSVALDVYKDKRTLGPLL